MNPWHDRDDNRYSLARNPSGNLENTGEDESTDEHESPVTNEYPADVAPEVLDAAMRAFGDTEIVGGPPSFTARAVANAVRAALASAGRNPEGHDRETGHGRNDEHAVAATSGETPSTKSGAPG